MRSTACHCWLILANGGLGLLLMLATGSSVLASPHAQQCVANTTASCSTTSPLPTPATPALATAHFCDTATQCIRDFVMLVLALANSALPELARHTHTHS
jgi:hypothetical protein